VRQLARCLVENPELAAHVDREGLAELLPKGPYADLIDALLESGARADAPAHELAAMLPDSARTLFFALSAESEPLAARTVDDTLEWLRKQHHRQKKREATRELRNAASDEEEKRKKLDERNRLLKEQKRDSLKPANPSAGPPV
jgi:hypothetical protein